jgi:hypothetical protein
MGELRHADLPARVYRACDYNLNMAPEVESAEVADRVQQLLANGLLQPPRSVAGAPLPVHNPNGTVHSWMVPFLAGTKLVAWAQLSCSLDLLRFSLPPGGLEAKDWLDPEQIAGRVSVIAGEKSTLSFPVLAYDRDPSRLVWAVVSSTPGEAIRRWFVAGDTVWEDTGEEEVTGGPPGIR